MANRAIIFDLDGTLIDSREDLARAGNHARSALGLQPLSLAEVASFVGDGAAKLVERLTPGCTKDERERALAAFFDHYGRQCTEQTRPYQGVGEMLDLLRGGGWLLAVATNKPLAFTLTILDACGLNQFTEVRGGDAMRKPDPGQLLSILAELAAEPGASWMVGDHRNDVIAGRAAGCSVMWCSWGLGSRDGLAVDAEAHSPGDIARLLGA